MVLGIKKDTQGLIEGRVRLGRKDFDMRLYLSRDSILIMVIDVLQTRIQRGDLDG